jgi:hypothetical protein
LTCRPPRTPPATPAAVRAYAKACVASLRADARQYTTVPAMDDLADVLRALGYRRVNLHGGSYGATAAQYFLVPGAGHGAVRLGCMPKVAQRFVEAGTAAGLDTSCVRRCTPPPF